MNDKWTGKGLRQVEHIRGHFWHRCSNTVSKVMVATIKLSKWWYMLTKRKSTIGNDDRWRLIGIIIHEVTSCRTLLPFSYNACWRFGRLVGFIFLSTLVRWWLNPQDFYFSSHWLPPYFIDVRGNSKGNLIKM